MTSSCALAPNCMSDCMHKNTIIFRQPEVPTVLSITFVQPKYMTWCSNLNFGLKFCYKCTRILIARLLGCCCDHHPYKLTVIILDANSDWTTYKCGSRCCWTTYTTRKSDALCAFHQEIIKDINDNIYGVARTGTNIKGHFSSRQIIVLTH